MLHGTLVKALLVVAYLSGCRWRVKARWLWGKCSVKTQASHFCVCTGVRWLVSPFERTFNFCSGVRLCGAQPLAVCEEGEGLGWRVGFILSVYPLQRKIVVGVCVLLSQWGSWNGCEAIGVTGPDVRSTHCWHGAVISEKETLDGQLTYHKISSKNQIRSCV